MGQPRRGLVEPLEERSLLSATPLGTEYQVNATVANDQRLIAIGSHPSATQSVMVWASAGEDGNGDGVYAQRLDLNGTKVGSPFRVNATTNGAQTAPTVALDSLGNFVVAWQSSTGDGSGDGIYARRYGFDGTALASEFRVNTTTSGNQQAPSIAMSDGGSFVVAFQSANRDASGNAVVARAFRANGTALANDFQVNQTTAGNQQAPSVAMDSAGNFIVSWQSAGQDGNGDAIVARRYGSTGTALAGEFLVNQATAGNQSAPSIAANGDGSFIVAWQSAGQDGSGDAIVARRFDSAGVALGAEFVVNQFTAGNQSAPSISSATGVGFVVAWQSALQDGNSDAVVARQYDASGAAAGDEFVVNTFVTGAQNNPWAAIEKDGDFQVAWQSPGQEVGGATSLGVFARRYSATNDAPVLKQIANQIADVGGTIAFTAVALDQDLAIDALTFSLAPGAPAGATIDPVTGVFSWSTAAGVDPGRYFVTVEVRDAAGLVDQKSVAMTVFAPGERTALDDYVNALDGNYKWDIRGRTVGDGYVKYDIRVTSGTWRTAAEVNNPLWQHWMVMYVPNEITQSRALLLIDGGSNSNTPPVNTDIDEYAGPIAAATGAVFIDLYSVPSQPLLFAGETSSRSEDSIIAYSWRKYLETGDPTWPLNLPMTRAAMRAMDAAADFLGSPVGGNFDIESFVVTGGSKRGWTTWLAAAADPRVSEAIPIVADLLNMEESFIHHYAYYNGTFSAAVNDYVSEGVLNVNNFGRDNLHELLGIVDPYTYLDRLTLPKYILNASGDEFFAPDSWSFYYDALPGPKSIRYAPNTGHGISDPAYLLDMFNVFLTFADGGSLPDYSFTQLADGTIQLTTSAEVTDAKLWRATNATKRDFRWPVVGAAFTSTDLVDLGGGVYEGNVPTPAQGWTAYFIQITVNNDLGMPITVSTGIYLKGPAPNERPILATIPDVIVDEGEAWQLPLSASDPDLNQVLAYSMTGAPAPMSIHPQTGLISGQWLDQLAAPYTVTVTVSDNGAPVLPDRETFVVTVRNVAPTPELQGPADGSPGVTQTFTLLATDPSSVDQAAGFTFRIDWNNDGIFDETVVGPSGVTVDHVFPALSSQTVSLTATDKDGGVSSPATWTINLNLAPIDPQNQQPYTLAEGDSLALVAAGWSDPNNDPLVYSWDVNGDLVFGDAVGSHPVLSWAQLGALGIDAVGEFAVRLRVSDGRGGVTETVPTLLAVVNAAPVVSLSGPSTLLRGSVEAYSLTAVDSSPDDNAAVFSYTIDWGDGSPVQHMNGSGLLTVKHAFSVVGSYVIQVTATDVRGATSVAATLEVAVEAFQFRPNGGNPELTDLVWGGTSGADRVELEQVDAATIRIREVQLNGVAVNQVHEFTNITGRVAAYGGAGDDLLDARGLTSTQATLDGYTGNNTLYGGAAGDVLIGGSDGGEGQQGNNVIIAGNGNNTIYGNGVTSRKGARGGDNLIVGGSGHDTIHGNFGLNPTGNGGEGGQNVIVGGGGEDIIYASQVVDGAEGGHGSILVAGTTTLDQAALLGVLAEWSSQRSYEARVANLLGTGTGVRLNGDDFLIAGVTVQNDASIDNLYSDTHGDLHWLFYDFEQDVKHRVKAGEVETDLP
ncbi:MAG: putative Ig domain-containing protein [Planctomycetaceae bacterium]|nr:putative Ig domain-containing protein [Planctomycetaceae bacterium]